jgi:hypothetical protein
MMRVIILTFGLFITGFNIMSCSQQEFSGDSGSNYAYKNGKNGPKKPGTSDGTKDDPSNPNSTAGNPLTPDDGGKVQLIDAELTITRNGDGAHFQNCMKGNIEGQPAVDLGCNRPAPYPSSYGGANPVKSVKIKLKTNTCNVLKLSMNSNSGSGSYPNITTASSVYSTATKPAIGPGYLVDKITGGFAVSANDNNDGNWGDLSLSITSANSAKIKFTIEGSGVPCP